MKLPLGVVASVVLASLLTLVPAFAGTATISIDSVGGRKIVNGQVTGTLFGKTVVQGAAVPGSAMPVPPPAKPLIADAGDSAFVASGDTFTLLGAGLGGQPPYTFAWTATVGSLDGNTSATALVNTTGVAPGAYGATLTVTDRSGASASDGVRFAVYQGPTVTYDQTQTDTTPGVLTLPANGTLLFPFPVAAGTKRIDVHAEWTVVANDYDLRLLDPNGKDVIDSGHGAGVPEDVSVSDPIQGTWIAALDKFTTIGDTVHVTVTATTPPVDPRPAVRAGGPYRFATGTTQTIAGTATGGTSALTSVGWDTDQDGALDRAGTSFTGSFGEGQRLITLKATDANGFERRETTSALVASADRLASVTTPFTIVAVNDTGVNAYHSEFAVETYPDPYVLALTNNFTRHPSEYIPGYPKDAQAIALTRGKGYLPPEDAHLWDQRSATSPNGLEYGKLYWIPGTKIIGATQPGALSCSNCEGGAHLVLDDDGHGSGSSSVSVGNRYGYCPSCLLFIEKGLNAGPAASYPWIDIQSNSWGTIANAPLDLILGTDPAVTRGAVERGQTVLFAAGNGTANAFDTPSPTYGTQTTGPDWNVVVGAIRRDNSRAIVGDGTPAHLSSWGDGNLPSACRTGYVSQCAFGGTSAATPYTSGIFGTVLTEIRRRIGDNGVGQRPGQVVASGVAIPGSVYLADGALTRAELREAVFKTAFPLNQDNAQTVPIFPYPLTAPYQGDINVLFEGYGAATPNSARRAIDVLLGKAPLPVREAEDRWFAIDRQIRDSLWGGYDRDGDGKTDSYGALGGFGFAAGDLGSVAAQSAAIRLVTDKIAAAALTTQTTGANAYSYWLHQNSDPAVADSPCANLVKTMDQSDSGGEPEPCYENRATSVLAAYRPLGIWPTTADADFAIPAGSNVTVEMYLTTSEVSIVRPTGVLMASDRVLGTGAATPNPTVGSGPFVVQGSPVGLPEPLPEGVAIDESQCKTLGELCWTRFAWSFTTTRPSIAGEQLTFQVQLIGARAFAFGYEGQHRSKITITPAAADASIAFSATVSEPAEGAKIPDQTPFTASGSATFPDLGSTPAGDHPATKRVDVSVDDATFATPTQATLTLDGTGRNGSWSAPLPALAPGAHTIYTRAAIGDTTSAVGQRHITVEDLKTSPHVQWQIVPAGSAPSSAGWSLAQGLLSWSFSFDTAAYGKGDFVIYARIIEGGLQTAITSVAAKFR